MLLVFCVGQSGRAEFKSAAELVDPVRTMHCTKEGGSYICQNFIFTLQESAALNVVKQRVLLRYGPYNVSRSLPVEGVADKDYEEHIRKVHLPDDGKEELALNDPRKPRHLASQFFTRHWGESFVETAEPPPLYNHRA
ncbi:putative vacuolar protein sorting-associated protein 54, partial [Trichinella spiralis]|uniref:putative vacuolar protein sorting-associated protein 54 n=1 Tax=Trichinella spiralis TaxID=6334 RepID=UPI0001EFEA2F